MKDGEKKYCSNFNTKKWDKKKVTFKGKLFVKDRAYSFFNIPLNFSSVIEKNIKKIEDAKAVPKDMMILFDKKSLFHSNIYISTKKAIPKVKDVKVTGTFLTKVFEGPSKNIKKWTKEMEEYVKSEKQEIKHMYFYYAEEKEKKYVVLFAEI